MNTVYPFTLDQYFGTLTEVWVVPLSDCKLTPTAPSLDVYNAGTFGVGQQTEQFPALNPQSVSLPFQLSRSKLDYGQLRSEPAITGLDWLFTPSPGSEEHLLVAPLQASTPFYGGFTLPGVRSSGFGSYPCDS